MIAWVVAVARNPELVERRMQELRTVLEHTAREVVVPIVVAHTAVETVHTVAAEAVQVDHMAVAVVHKAAAEAAQVDYMAVAVAAPIVVHKVVEVARMAAGVVDSDLAAAVGLDHKT